MPSASCVSQCSGVGLQPSYSECQSTRQVEFGRGRMLGSLIEKLENSVHQEGRGWAKWRRPWVQILRLLARCPIMRVKEKEQGDTALLRGAPEDQLLLSLVIRAPPSTTISVTLIYLFFLWDFIIFSLGIREGSCGKIFRAGPK
jgi:hypothetical protein